MYILRYVNTDVANYAPSASGQNFKTSSFAVMAPKSCAYSVLKDSAL